VRRTPAAPPWPPSARTSASQDLVGKSVAIVADARLNTANANVVVERLLSISGEDSLTIDRKYKDHWFGKLDTRFVIFSNELPGFGDASGAIATRFLVLTLGRSWLGKENHDLTTELLGELPGILNWSLDGLARLRAQDRFTEPPSSRDAIVALADTVSPISAFVRDCCEVGVALEVAVDDLYQAWRTWCDQQGRDRPGSAMTFGKNLRAAQPSVRKTRPRDGDQRVQRYSGITLRQQWPVTVTNRDHTAVDTGPVTVPPERTPRSEGVVTAGHSKAPLLFPLADSAEPTSGVCTRCGKRTGLTDDVGKWRCSRCRLSEEGAA
jgi:putative DNA primase/helicase